MGKSVLWDCFTEKRINSKPFGVCNDCETAVSTSGNTSNLLAHLGSFHHDFYATVRIRLDEKRQTRERGNRLKHKLSNNSLILADLLATCSTARSATPLSSPSPTTDAMTPHYQGNLYGQNFIS